MTRRSSTTPRSKGPKAGRRSIKPRIHARLSDGKIFSNGKRLFSEGTIPSGLKLVDSKVSTTGVMIGTYEPGGEIVTGLFALE